MANDSIFKTDPASARADRLFGLAEIIGLVGAALWFFLGTRRRRAKRA